MSHKIKNGDLPISHFGKISKLLAQKIAFEIAPKNNALLFAKRKGGAFLATEESELHENELIAITIIALHAKMSQGEESSKETPN